MTTKYSFTLIGFLLLFLFSTKSKAAPSLPCDSLVYKSIDAMQEKKHNQSLELLTQAQKKAQDTKDYTCLFLVYNNMGANYYGLLDYGEALDNYLKAYQVALKHLESSKEMVVLNNIAILYSKDSKHKKAEEYFLKAYQIAKKEQDSKRIAQYATNLGLVSNQLKKLSAAKQYLEEALSLIKKSDELQIESQLGLAENYLLQHKPNKSITIIQSLIEESKLENKNIINQNQETAGLAYYLLSKSYQYTNNIQKAIAYAEKSLQANKNLDHKKEVFILLSELYQKDENFQQALTIKDSLLKTQTQIFSIKNGRLFETNKVKFEMQQFQQELTEKDQVLKAERRIYSIIIACILIIVLFIIYAWRNSKIKHTQRKILVQQKQALLTLELEKEKSDHLLLEKKLKEQENAAELEKKRLELKVEKRNRKLTITALQKGNKNETIKNIIHSLLHHPTLKNNQDIKSYINELKKYLKSEERKEDDFLRHFEEVNPIFIKTLTRKHPQLTSNDIRFLCYLYMNLSTKEIAGLFNITPAACRKRKERIATKLKLQSSSELYSYIFSIF